MKIRAPKGTVLIRKFKRGQQVAPTVQSRKCGTLKLISGVVLDRNTVYACYGRI